MSIDGVFIHHLVDELQIIKNTKINKVIRLNDYDYIFNLSRKNKLLITVNSNHPHIRMTNYEVVTSSQTNNFYNTLKKYFENNYISELSQYHNDRVIVIKTNHYDELGFEEEIILIIEAMGRNSNLIICNNDFTIIDCLKKSINLIESNRIIVPKVKYQFPLQEKLNPFETNEFNYNENIYEGVSKQLFEEFKYQKSLDILHNPVKPTIITTNDKKFFYCYDLQSLVGDRTYFNSLSLLLDDFYSAQDQIALKNNEQKLIETYIKKEIQKNNNKLNKQETELQNANNNLQLEKIGNILSTNLYQVKYGTSSITLYNYYDNCDITIELNPLLSPSDNLSTIFAKYKKAKRTIEVTTKQIEQTKLDIQYYESIIDQLEMSKNLDLKEIIEELDLTRKAKQTKTARKSRPNITIYNDIYGGTILVGKNNIQNNYLTHTLANKDDYFFHVKSIGGSHVILRNEGANEKSIALAADIAAYYSKYRTSVNANVDMTKVKNVKKVPGTKGSFVTYNTYKTIFANPNYDKIKEQIKS